MIRINLLPIRQIKKRARLRKEALAAVGLLFVVILALGVYHLVLQQNITTTNNEIAALIKSKEQYEPIIKELAELKKIKQDLEAKLGAIKKLKKGSQLTVRVLDAVANLVPQNRLWVDTMTQTGLSLTMSGTALDNATIAQFMRELGASRIFTEPELSATAMKEIAGKKLKSFNLSMAIQAAPKEEPGKTDKDKPK